MRCLLRILYIHQFVFGPSDPGFTRPLDVLGKLARLGHEPKIISGFYSHITRERVPRYARKFYCIEKIGGVEVCRVPGIFSLRSSARKLVHHGVFMMASILAGMISRCDLVVASSPPPFVALSGWFLSRIKKVPFVLEVRDLWPEDLVQEGLLQDGIASRIMEDIMKRLYRKADLIIALTAGIGAGIQKRGIAETKIAFIPNSVNAELFDHDEDGRALRSDLGLKQKFVVVYAGNHGKSNALDTLVRSAAILKNEPDICFLFVGDGEQKQNLMKMAESMDLKNVVFLPPQPKCRMPEIFGASDASIIPLKNVPVYDGALPNKLLDSMASGKPVILAAGNEARSVVLNAGAGVIADPEDAESIADKVSYLYKNQALSKDMGKSGRMFVLEHFSHERTARELEARLLHVVGPGRRAHA